jgi:hypothetical protein
MSEIDQELDPQGSVALRVAVLFGEMRMRIFKQTDRLFAGLMVLQWLGRTRELRQHPRMGRDFSRRRTDHIAGRAGATTSRRSSDPPCDRGVRDAVFRAVDRHHGRQY